LSIAYFQLPKEEFFGAKGYIDDIYLSLYVLRDLKDEYGIQEIIEHWEDDPKDLKRLLTKDFDRLHKKFGYILNDILDYVGLNEFYSVPNEVK
jgi:uncharacterized membrane protein YkvA (DUF1232 family)